MRDSQKTKGQLITELAGLRQIVENTGNVIFSLRLFPFLHFDYISPAIGKMAGVSVEELTARADLMYEFIHPDDRPLLAALLASPDPAKSSVSLRYAMKNGRNGWVEVDYEVDVKDGQPVAVNGIARDITARMTAEKALRASEERYRTLIEDLPVGIAVATKDGRPIQRNGRMLEISGFNNREAASAMPVINHYANPADRERFLALLGKGPVFGFEVQQRRADGSSFWASLSSRYRVTPSGEKQIITVLQDITDHKRAEEDIRLKAELLEAASDAIFLRDFDTGSGANLLYVNEAAVRTFGYNREELLNMNMRELSTSRPADVEKSRQRLIETGKNRSDIFFRCKNGTVIPVENRASVATVGGKKFILNVVRDATERIKAEEALRYQAAIAGAAYDPIIAVDKNFRVTSWNKASEQVYGWKAEEVLGKMGSDLLHTEFADGATRDEIRKQFLKDGFWRGEIVNTRKDGGKLNILASNAALYDNEGNFNGVVYFHHNITERKQAEQILRASEEKFRTLVENLPVGVAISRPDGTVIERNRALAEIYGYTSVEELRSRPATEFYADPEERERFLRRLEKGPVRNFEVRRRRRDGSVFWGSLTAISRETESGEKQIFSMIQDITDRKLAEEENSLKATLLDAATDGIVLRDFNEGKFARLIYVNRAASRISGYSEAELRKLTMRDLSRRTTAETVEARRQELDRGNAIFFEGLWQRKDGTPVPVENHSSIITIGDRRYLFSIIRDISNRKQAEEALRASEEKYRTLVENAPIGISVTTMGGKRLECNKALAEMVGFNSKQEWLKTLASDVYANPEDRIHLMKMLESGPVQNFEFRRKRLDGSVFWASISSVDFTNFSGEKLRINILQNIDERKRIEEELRASEEKFRTLVENAPVGLSITTMNGRRLEANRAVVGLFGYDSKEEFLNSPVFDTYIDLKHRNSLLALLEKGPFQNYELPRKRKDGSAFWVAHTSIPFKSPSGETRFINVLQDITLRRQAEDALKASEEKFRTLLEYAPVGLTLSTFSGQRLEANRSAIEMHGYGTREEFLNVPVADTYVDLQDRQYLKALVEKGPFRSYELRRKRRDGSVFWAALTSIPFETSSSEKHLINVIQDITQRKKAEEALIASRQELRNFSAYLEAARENERANIAREVHDELGQVLTALRMDLIWLKGRLPSSQRLAVDKLNKMVELVDATAKHVRGIAARLRPGLLDDFGLPAAVEWEAKEFSNRTGIACDVKFEPAEPVLERDMATSLYRIFQEGLTNIARHARAKHVNFSFKWERQQLLVIIEDNGVGITPEQTLSPGSLGIIGMRERVIYWDGRIDIDGRPGKGTTITIIIPLKKE